ELAAADTTDRVDARRELERDRLRIDLMGAQPALLGERLQPGPRGGAQRAQATAYEHAVLADERHAVCDRRDRLPLMLGGAGRAAEREQQLADNPRGAQLRERIVAWARGAQDRVRKLWAGLVVVTDDRVHAKVARVRDRLHSGDATVHGDEQARAVASETLD